MDQLDSPKQELERLSQRDDSLVNTLPNELWAEVALYLDPLKIRASDLRAYATSLGGGVLCSMSTFQQVHYNPFFDLL